MKWLSAVVLTVLVAMAGPVMACSLVDSGLPDDVRKELELKCLQARKAVAEKTGNAAMDSQVSQISNYAGIATEVAKAVGLAAKELGIAANEFILTPAGIITMLFVVFKVFGKLFAMIAIAIAINLIIWRLVKRIWYYESGETMEVVGWFGWGKKTIPVIKRTTYQAATDGQVILTLFLGIIALGSLIMIPVSS